MIITRKLEITGKAYEPNEKELQELATARTMPIVLDDDCPELTDEQIEKYLASSRSKLKNA